MNRHNCCHQHPPARNHQTSRQAAKKELEHSLGHAIATLILSGTLAAILWFALANRAEHTGAAFTIHTAIAALMTTLAMLALAAVAGSIDEYQQTVKRTTSANQRT